jgi:hypothetical protein
MPDFSTDNRFITVGLDATDDSLNSLLERNGYVYNMYDVNKAQRMYNPNTFGPKSLTLRPEDFKRILVGRDNLLDKVYWMVSLPIEVGDDTFHILIDHRGKKYGFQLQTGVPVQLYCENKFKKIYGSYEMLNTQESRIERLTEIMTKEKATNNVQHVPNKSWWMRFIEFLFGKGIEDKPKRPGITEQVMQMTTPQIDPHQESLNISTEKIKNLTILSNFFGNQVLQQILTQCHTIHKIFERNKEIHVKKLEQFHYYYTDNLADMLRKLKKSKEENILILTEKSRLIQEQIDDIKSKKINIREYNNAKKRYASEVSHYLSNIYNALTGDIEMGSLRFAEFGDLGLSMSTYFGSYDKTFAEIDMEAYRKLTEFEVNNNTYKYNNFTIEKKLMGRLFKNKFYIEFVNALCAGPLICLFKIADTTDYFIYVPEKRIFKLCAFSTVHTYLENTGLTKDDKQKMDLVTKKEEMLNLTKNMKSITDADTLATLDKYYAKISEVDFLNKLSDIDIERQHLQNMLNASVMEI